MSVVPTDLDAQLSRRSADGRCGLLVSVRDETEAREALAGGATIVDVKEPGRGPLGAAAGDVTARIAAVVGGRTPWTLAGGELRDGVAAIHEHVRRTIALLDGDGLPPAAAKAGLAGTAAGDWRSMLAAFKAGLPAGIEPVAVAYADWDQAGSPPPEEVIAAASATGYRVLLADTFDKSGPPVVNDAESARRVGGWIAQARRAGMRAVLAGNLSLESLPAALACGPDVIAVRSAACVGGRSGTVCGKLVRRLGKLCGRAGADPSAARALDRQDPGAGT
jgi:uncharacterized protein (UPF0264 family)